MKIVKITLVLAFVVGVMILSSCGKKGCHKPEDKKDIHHCHHDNDESLETVSG